MFQKLVKVLGGDPHRREIEKFSILADEINDLEDQFEALSDEGLLEKTAEFRARYHDLVEDGMKGQDALDDLLPEAFAAVREASKRTIGLRHYDVQLIGGAVLHQGKIAEMRTGEGKTLVATLPMYLNTITTRGVHLVTVNDYLARRDARWMSPIFRALGLTVGVLQMAARTDNGKAAFLIDPERTSPHEDQHQLRMVPRKEAYAADITYGTNAEFGFDYLRDNLTMSLQERVQRGHYYAIVDEVDNILIDEARTPLIISGPAADDAEWYVRISLIVRQLRPEDFEISEKERTVSLTELGEAHVEELLETPLKDPERPEDITPEQARLLGFLEQSLRAHHLYKRNKDYLVQGGKVVIVDEFTGRLMPGRRWSEGLHQSIEAKEGVKVEPENVTYATITLQNYYRMYEKLAGMTGTAATEAEEFHKIYKLEVITIPTNLENEAVRQGSELLSVEDKDEQGYKYLYYARRDDPQRQPIFWKRKDFTDVVYRTEEAKLRAITQEILRYHLIGRPQLVGTTSVEHSERLSRRLQADPIRRLAQVMLIRQAYLDKENKELIERPVPELQPLNTPLSDMDSGDLRPVARSLGVSLNPEDDANLSRLLGMMSLTDAQKPRLLKAMQGGVTHQVLNARKHDEESQIIARAGAFGAVTIATNMAGRGVDIKLGGELPDEVINDTNRVISRLGLDPYNMTNDERRQALANVPVEDYGIYEESVTTFMNYEENMVQVRSLGGLHVIGSERHEARRIDNQLRGRAARQGDPGSSRFYLSLEDELMRLFGGPQVESLWKRVFFDDNLPLEMGLLGRLVEQSQEKVEGYNFDVRKHLLEYDDVLNAQRKRIYEQRDRAFTKEDLSEDVLDMLRAELQLRIPEALKDEEGPWKLLAYLEEIQPAFSYGIHSFPSFPLALLRDETTALLEQRGQTQSGLVEIILETAGRCLDFEKEHILTSVRSILEKGGEALEHQLEERFEVLNNFAESLGDGDETSQGIRPQELLMQLSEQVRVPIKLNTDHLRRLPVGAQDVFDEIGRQVSLYVKAINLGRLNNSFERRLEEPLGLRLPELVELEWPEVSTQFLGAVKGILDRRIERLLGDQGQIAADLNSAISRINDNLFEDKQIIQLLLVAATGTRTVFDPKTHRKGTQRVNRLNYIYLAAQTLRDSVHEEVTQVILRHLEEGLEVLQAARGSMVWNRMSLNGAVLEQVESSLKDQLIHYLGEDRFIPLADQPLASMSQEDRESVSQVFGWRLQNQAYRELFLRIISDQWVDYLTKVEALRVSVGMESYGQRDPLVQYKSQATDMFKTLLADIRMGIIGRLFTYQPRITGAAMAEGERVGETPDSLPEEKIESPADSEIVPPGYGEEMPSGQQPDARKKKRRRH